MLGLAADTNSFGVVTAIAIRRGAASTDPFITALMTLFLFLKPLLQRLHQLVPATHFFNGSHFFGAEILLRNRLQPIRRNIDRVLPVFGKNSFEYLAKNLVEPVE